MTQKKKFCIVSSNYTSLIAAWEGSEKENKKFLHNREVLMEVEAEDEQAAISKYRAINEGVAPSFAQA